MKNKKTASLNPSREIATEFTQAAKVLGYRVTFATDAALRLWLVANRAAIQAAKKEEKEKK